jgi:glycosyltransferase involved in cell wall biosynthesis
MVHPIGSVTKVPHERIHPLREEETTPLFVSVIVRSYRRPQALLELLAVLRTQRYEPFEVVICEQTQDPKLIERIQSLKDERIRVVQRPPLGAPGARNEAVRYARGAVFLFVDDDDLPLSDDWILSHAKNYTDPRCLGVGGRLVAQPKDKETTKVTRRAQKNVMSHTGWKDAVCYWWLGERKVGIDHLMGSNASMRRSLVDRAGGWDEGISHGEEHSFYFRCKKTMSDSEYFVFDPKPVAWRRTCIPGGLDRRTKPFWYFLEQDARARFYLRVVAHYFPLRFWLLSPLYPFRLLYKMWDWIFDSDNNHIRFIERVWASIAVVFLLPVVLLRQGLLHVGPGIKRTLSLGELQSEKSGKVKKIEEMGVS